MKRDVLIVTSLLFFLLGVAIASICVFFTLMPILVLFAVIFWFIVVWKDIEDLSLKNFVILFFVSILAVFFGFVRFFVDDFLFSSSISDDISGDFVTVFGVVDSLSEFNKQKQDFLLRVTAVDSDRLSKVVNERLFITLPYTEKIVYGEFLLLKGQLILSSDSTLIEFLRQKLYRIKSIGILRNTTVLKRFNIERKEPWSSIFDLRAILLEYFSSILGEPAASLLNGVLIGERGSIPPALAKAFQITGLTHILAISGFNVTIIINIFILCTAWLPRRLRLFPTIFAIVVFVILTGASASVVRAAVMGILIFTVKTLGHQVSAFKALLLSVFLIVCVDPRLLGLDISFQLSVLATISLVFFSSLFETNSVNSFYRVLIEGFSTTIAAQIISLPYIFYHFGTISLISPVANLLIGPMIPILMLAGVCLLVFTFIPGPFLLIAIGLTQLLVFVMTFIIEILSIFPFAQIEFGQGMLWFVLLYYVLIFIFARKYMLNSKSSAFSH